MGKKRIRKVNLNINGFVVDGVEYVSKTQAVEMAGTTYPTLRKKVALFGIKEVKLPMSRLPVYRKKDIVDAIKNGWFQMYL